MSFNGMVVQLKSGGPIMTVIDDNALPPGVSIALGPTGFCECQWWDAKEKLFKTVILATKSLYKVDM